MHLEDCGEITANGVSDLLDCKALEDLLLRHNGPGLQRNFIFRAASEMPLLRKLSLDVCDASEGDFDIPSMTLPEKFVLNLVPAVGACFSIFYVIFLWKKENGGHFVGYHKWFYICSELLVWANIILFLKCASSHCIVFNRVLCFWWILKPVLGVFHLITKFPSLEVSVRIMESLVVLLNITFGVAINVIRIKRQPSKSSLLKDPLLSSEGDLEEGVYHDRAHYVGRLENGKVFDSSYDRGKPLTFRVGVGEFKQYQQGILLSNNCRFGFMDRC